MEDISCLTECVNRDLYVMRFTIRTGLKLTPFELHQGRKLRPDITNVIKDEKSFLSNWSKLYVSANNRPKISMYISRNGKREVSNHIIMARTKAVERAMTEKSPKKKNLVNIYRFKFFEKNHNKKSLEGKYQKKSQTAVNGTEHTVTTVTGKTFHRKFSSGPVVFQKERKTSPKIGDTNAPKNRHCL